MPVSSTSVEISDHCVGDRWKIDNEDELASLVALVARAQAIHAQNILLGLTDDPIVFEAGQEAEIRQSAIQALTVPIDATGIEIRGPKKWHRDGVLFEAISWLAARKQYPDAIMRDPHISPTTQGLDGLMIQLNGDRSDVDQTIIFEDKCVEDPVKTFRNDTLPALKRFHVNSRKVLESAGAILQTALPRAQSPAIAAKSIAMAVRGYRASFPIPPSLDDVAGRTSIFERYEQIGGILKERRIGATLISTDDIRDWFEQFAKQVIAKL